MPPDETTVMEWRVKELREYAKERSIFQTIIGTGSEGAVLKADLTKAVLGDVEQRLKLLKITGEPKKHKTGAGQSLAKPRVPLNTPPWDEQQTVDKYHLWKMEMEDWEKKAQKDGHTVEDLYEKLKGVMSSEKRLRFMMSHQVSEKRTYANLKKFVGKRHEETAFLVGEMDRKRYENFRRGNWTFAEGRERWEELRTTAMASGGIETDVKRDHLVFAEAMQLGTKVEAEVEAQVERRMETSIEEEKPVLEFWLEEVKRLERAYARADMRRKMGEEEKKGKSALTASKEATSTHESGQPKDGVKKEKTAKKPKEETAQYASTGKKGAGKGGGSWKRSASSPPSSGQNGKGGGKGLVPFKPPCRFGRECKREDCWFWHPSKDASAGKGTKSSSKGKGGQKGATERPGDWKCPACQDHQFAKNEVCRKCGTARPK